MISLGETVVDRCATIIAALGALLSVGVGLLNAPSDLHWTLINFIVVLAWIASPYGLVIYLAASNEWAQWAKSSLLMAVVGIGALSYYFVMHLLDGPVFRGKAGIGFAILPFIQLFVLLTLIGCVAMLRRITQER